MSNLDAVPSSLEDEKTSPSMGTPSEAANSHNDVAFNEKEPEAGKNSSENIMETFPEGGLKAWVTMAGAAGVMFCTFGMTQAFGVFQDYYTRVLLEHYSPSAISWIGSLQIFFLYAMGLFTGKWFDDGYFHHMLIPGSILYVFSFFMLSLCEPNQYYQFFLSQGLGMGLGMGLMAVPAISIISHYFRERRALASGIVFSGTSLGGIIWPIMLNRLIEGEVGFAWAVRSSAFICLGMLVFANMLMRPRFSVSERKELQPSSTIKTVLSDWNWGICLVGVFITTLGLSFPFVFLQLFASLHGVPDHIAQYTLAIFFASGTVFGRMLPGLLADRFGVLNVLLVYTIVGGGLIFAMFGASSSAGLIVFAILYGPCGGAFNSLFPATLGSYAGSVSEFGLRLGIAGVVFGFGYLVGSPITGALLRAPHYDWTSSIIFSGVTVLGGCGIILISRHILVRRKGTQKV